MMKKTINKVLAMTLVAAMAVTGINVADQSASAKTSAKTKKITMSASKVLLKVKGKKTLKVKSVSPKKASKKVTYKSSNKKIATVSAKGVVKATKKAGTVTITVTSKVNKKVKAKVKVYVAKVVPTKVKLSKSKLTLTVKKTKTLKVTLSPKKAYSKNFKWTTSNKKVATVSSKGKVTAKKIGKATVKYTSLNGKVGKCVVTVKAATVPTVAPTAPVSTAAVTTKSVIGTTISSEQQNSTFATALPGASIVPVVAKSYAVSATQSATYTLDNVKIGTTTTFVSAGDVNTAATEIANISANLDKWNTADATVTKTASNGSVFSVGTYDAATSTRTVTVKDATGVTKTHAVKVTKDAATGVYTINVDGVDADKVTVTDSLITINAKIEGVNYTVYSDKAATTVAVIENDILIGYYVKDAKDGSYSFILSDAYVAANKTSVVVKK